MILCGLDDWKYGDGVVFYWTGLRDDEIGDSSFYFDHLLKLGDGILEAL